MIDNLLDHICQGLCPLKIEYQTKSSVWALDKGTRPISLIMLFVWQNHSLASCELTVAKIIVDYQTYVGTNKNS